MEDDNPAMRTPLEWRQAIYEEKLALAQWVGACGVQLQPLVDALRDCLLQQDVILADETTVQMLAPGTKKTQRAYVWAYAPSP
ncbi:transposase, partial [Pseudomonas aeruginosa]|nr:transposase [Pseudomonas aeruginosa]